MNEDSKSPGTAVPVDSVPALDNVEPGAVLRAPAESPVQQVSVESTPGSEPPANNDAAWPWENNASAAAPAPTVQTDQMYRSAGAPAHPEAASPFGADATQVTPSVAAATATAAPVATEAPQAQQPPQVYSYGMYGETPMADDGRFGTFYVFLLIVLLTGAGVFLDLMMNGQLTWITGVLFIASSFMASLAVRRRDLWMGVIAPPIAFVIALLLGGQPSTFSGTGSLFLREASLVVTGLAYSAPYIFGGTLLALIVVLIRRSKFKRADKSAAAPTV